MVDTTLSVKSSFFWACGDDLINWVFWRTWALSAFFKHRCFDSLRSLRTKILLFGSGLCGPTFGTMMLCQRWGTPFRAW